MALLPTCLYDDFERPMFSRLLSKPDKLVRICQIYIITVTGVNLEFEMCKINFIILPF